MDLTNIIRPASLTLSAYKGDDFSLLLRFRYSDESPIDLSLFQDITWRIVPRGVADPAHSFTLTGEDLQLDGDDNELLKSDALDAQMTEELGGTSGHYRHDIQFHIDSRKITLLRGPLKIDNIQGGSQAETHNVITINEVTNEVTVDASLDAALIALQAESGSLVASSAAQTAEANAAASASSAAESEDGAADSAATASDKEEQAGEAADRAESEADRSETAATITSRPSPGAIPLGAHIGYQLSDGSFHRMRVLELAAWIQEAQNYTLDAITAEWNQQAGDTTVTVT